MDKLTEIRNRYADGTKWAADPEDVRYLLQLVETQAKALEESHTALSTIANCDVPYAPITDHSVMRFYEKTAHEAIETIEALTQV